MRSGASTRLCTARGSAAGGGVGVGVGVGAGLATGVGFDAESSSSPQPVTATTVSRARIIRNKCFTNTLLWPPRGGDCGDRPTCTVTRRVDKPQAQAVVRKGGRGDPDHKP